MFFWRAKRNRKAACTFTHKPLKYNLWTNAHFFSPIYIFLLIFLSQLNKKKSGQSGQKCKKQRKYVIFCGQIHFQKWAESGQSGQKNGQECPYSFKILLNDDISHSIFSAKHNKNGLLPTFQTQKWA